MGYDLSLLPPRGTLLSPSEQEQFYQLFCSETRIDEITEVWKCGLSRLGPYDLRRLEDCIRSGEFSRSEYDAFCAARNLTPGASEAKAYAAARLFCDYKWGQDFVGLKLPITRSEVRDVYRTIIDFARRHSVLVHDPQVGSDINLDSPGEYPPMYGPA